MKVITQTNNSLSEEVLEKKGGPEVWLRGLDRFLSDDAQIRLSLMYRNEVTEAKLNISDKGIYINSSAVNENQYTALDAAIYKSMVQLAKIKTKSTHREPFIDDEVFYDLKETDALIDLEPAVTSEFEELQLNAKKATPRYERTVDKYIDYLNFCEEIERAEEHLRILYTILDTEQDTILLRDYNLLTKSIVDLEKTINLMLAQKKDFLSKRDQYYIEETIDEELHILSLKREKEAFHNLVRK